MSKILDLLNYNKKRRPDPVREETDDFSGQILPENFDTRTKEKLANTYIFNATPTNENAVKKPDKLTETKYGPGLSKFGFTQLVPWLISFLAILLLLANIVYRGKININVEFLDGDIAQSNSIIHEGRTAKTDFTPKINLEDAAPIPLLLVGGGRPNNYIVKRIGFYGAAVNKSLLLDDGFYLFNDGSTGWASIGIDLAVPMDFSDITLDFFIKGAKGKESLNLMLRDDGNKSYMPQAHNTIFNKDMKDEWQFVSISFNNFTGPYNPKRINHIGFEFGTQTTANTPGSSIYIKNIKLVKNTGGQ